MRLLVVEDDGRMADLLRRGLLAEGYAVDVVGSAEDGRFMGVENDYDAIVMDVNLPDGDGFEVCRALRAAGRWSPIIVLSAREAVDDRVRGLDVGADDYLVKPFSFAELAARLRALVRRGAVPRPSRVTVGLLDLDPAGHTVALAGVPLALTAREYALLELLLRRAGQTLSRTEIIEHVWDWAYDGTSNVVDVYIGYLRAKLGSGPAIPVIETVRGIGYRLAEPRPARADGAPPSGGAQR
jgi:two-component system, OmpR family, response regulator